MDQSAIEDLFERNADMRLLEFRHTDAAKGPKPQKRSGSSFGAESIVSTMPDAELEPGPRLRVSIAAAPGTGVIAGAVVGVAIDVFNDGNAPAPEAKLLLSLPIETEFRNGTLRIDGRETQAPEQLFGHGLPIARLPNATSTKVTFQLAILPGVNTLYLQPRLQSNGVPIVGTSGISIKRATPGAVIDAPAPLPFYELDEEETAEVLAETAEPILPPVIPRPDPQPAPVTAAPAVTEAKILEPVIIEPPAAEPVVVEAAVQEPLIVAPAVAEPAVPPPPPIVAPAREAKARAPRAKPAAPKASAPASATAPVEAEMVAARAKTPPPAAVSARPAKPLLAAAASDERMIRYRTLSAGDIALLERLFTPVVPGIIAHYVTISTLACSEPATGDDASGFSAFLRRDIELLGRALVHSRMGKAPQYRVAQSDLNGLSLAWEQTPQSFPPQRRLRRDLKSPELKAIAALLAPSERDATLRTRIALLALAASSVDGVDNRAADECAAALSAYRSSVLAWLVPLCVASAASGAFEIPPPPMTVDAAGRHLSAALKSALTV